MFPASIMRDARSGRSAVVGLSLSIACMLACPAAQSDETNAEGIEFFEANIRPVLVEHCYKCHSQQVKSPKGGLRLDSREGIRSGGESGHAVVPNDVDESLIISALKYESFEMPPSGRLDEEVIENFETWIQRGAPDPRDEPSGRETPSTADADDARRYWAFQPPRTVTPPPSEDEWIYTDVDRFVLQRQREAGVSAVADAEPATLLRRVYFDLIGLPPRPDEVIAFLKDPTRQHYEEIVDRLLNSTHFGERWGRHWLDVVRYAESTGKTRNFPYPFAWRYRDYVIRSFNDDKPFDQFVREQLAGDLIPAGNNLQRDEQRIATGFLALGSPNLNENNNEIYRMEVVGEQVDVLGRALMGLTIGCARCHDHKFDPIPTADYYALAGIFRSSQVLNGYTNRRRNNQYADADRYVALTDAPPLDDDVTERNSGKDAADLNVLNERIESTKRLIAQLRRRIKLQARQEGSGDSDGGDLQSRLKGAQRRLRNFMRRASANPPARTSPQSMTGPYAMGVRDAKHIADCPIHVGGDVKQLGEVVPRGFLTVLSSGEHQVSAIPDDQSGRLELALWLTQDDHPLTSRVFVNRIWQHLFGTGIVATVDNFGVMGGRPSHPDLLDYLAGQFIQNNWSTKRLIRKLATSHVYQLSGRGDLRNADIDGDNRLLWRMQPRRLEAEAIRDAMLTVSGKLILDAPEGSVVQDLPIAPLRRQGLNVKYNKIFHRSIYLPIVRSRVPQYLTTFDFPEPSDVKGSRDVTTVATQALFMLNSPFVRQQAREAADRLLKTHGHSRPRPIVRQAYLLTVSRLPSDEQLERAVDYWQEMAQSNHQGPATAERKAVTDLIHALLGCAEFRYH